jgi:NADH-quinone oxidoreductase subunit A
MGSIGIFSSIICIALFSIILYWSSVLYSFFFSRAGKNLLHRDFYECGFRAIVDNNVVLDIHFSIIGIIFLIYEMEIILFVPILLNFYSMSFSLYIIMLFSLFLLGISYFYEWERYGLSWVF